MKVQPTSDSTAQQLAHLVLLSRLTQGRGFAGLFQPSTPGSHFGHGGDPSGYVKPKDFMNDATGQEKIYSGCIASS